MGMTTTEVSDIDMELISMALRHDGSPVCKEVAGAINTSIDKFCSFMDETVEWLQNDPAAKYICENAKDL